MFTFNSINLKIVRLAAYCPTPSVFESLQVASVFKDRLWLWCLLTTLPWPPALLCSQLCASCSLKWPPLPHQLENEGAAIFLSPYAWDRDDRKMERERARAVSDWYWGCQLESSSYNGPLLDLCCSFWKVISVFRLMDAECVCASAALSSPLS